MHATQLIQSTVPGLVGSPLGISLFGLFGLFGMIGAIAVLLLLANLFGGRTGAHGEPSGRGLVIGFLLLIAATLALDAALG